MEPVLPQGDGLVAGWALQIGVYRFFVDSREVAACVDSLALCPVHHAPSWLTGMALVDARPAGVIDLGRFLGLSRTMPGPVLVPAPSLHSVWLVQAHRMEPVQAIVTEATVPEDPALDERNPLAARKPPAFRVGHAQWTAVDGGPVAGEALSLALLLGHPRLRELQS